MSVKIKAEPCDYEKGKIKICTNKGGKIWYKSIAMTPDELNHYADFIKEYVKNTRVFYEESDS